jgi:hypothetical protein
MCKNDVQNEVALRARMHSITFRMRTPSESVEKTRFDLECRILMQHRFDRFARACVFRTVDNLPRILLLGCATVDKKTRFLLGYY